MNVALVKDVWTTSECLTTHATSFDQMEISEKPKDNENLSVTGRRFEVKNCVEFRENSPAPNEKYLKGRDVENQNVGHENVVIKNEVSKTCSSINIIIV